MRPDPATLPSRPRPRRARRSTRRLATLAVAATLVALLALPAAAYTIYLKDGSTINAEKKWEEIDGKAVITLPGGIRSTLDLGEIDIERSVRANKDNLGTATVIDGPNPRTERPAVAGADA